MPPSWPEMLFIINCVPNPALPLGAVTVGPPFSDHVRVSEPSWAMPDTASVPVGTERAPYLMEFVANSWTTRARVVADASPTSNWAVRLICTAYCHKESPSFISVACSHDDPASDRKPWIVRNLSQKSPSSAQDLCEPHPIENAQAEFVEIGRANVSSSARSLMSVHRTNQTHGPTRRASRRSRRQSGASAWRKRRLSAGTTTRTEVIYIHLFKIFARPE